MKRHAGERMKGFRRPSARYIFRVKFAREKRGKRGFRSWLRMNALAKELGWHRK